MAAILMVCLPIAVAAQERDAWTAVVVARNSPIESIGLDALARIYRRRQHYWPDGSAAFPVNLPAGDAVRRRFSIAVLGRLPEELEDYWNQQYFQGVLPPHVLESARAVAGFVAQTDGAVGYLPNCEVPADLRRIGVIDEHGHWQMSAGSPSCEGRE